MPACRRVWRLLNYTDCWSQKKSELLVSARDKGQHCLLLSVFRVPTNVARYGYAELSHGAQHSQKNWCMLCCEDGSSLRLSSYIVLPNAHNPFIYFHHFFSRSKYTQDSHAKIHLWYLSYWYLLHAFVIRVASTFAD